MDFEIRPAATHDIERLIDINIASWRESYAHFLSPEFLSQLENPRTRSGKRQAFEQLLGDTVVLVRDGDLRGYATARAPKSPEPPRDLELLMIYQLASEHGSGSGQALLDAVLADRPAFVWVAENNPRAIAFYRRNGFAPDGASETAPDEWENLVEIRMIR